MVTFVQFKERENTHEGMLLLVKVRTLVCNFTKSNTPLGGFFTFFNLYKWYQYCSTHLAWYCQPRGLSASFFYLRKLFIKSKQVNQETSFLFKQIVKILGIFVKIMKMFSTGKFNQENSIHLKECLTQVLQNRSPFFNVFQKL